MQAGVLVRAVQAESGDGDVERRAGCRDLHMILPGHEARRCGKRRAGRIFVPRPRLDHRLLTHYTLAMHGLHAAMRIGNAPAPPQQLDGEAPAIDDRDMIRPDELPRIRFGLVSQIKDLDLNRDIFRGCFKTLVHGLTLTQQPRRDKRAHADEI
jgi:hypothetical protein